MAEFWSNLFVALPNSYVLHIHRGQRHLRDAERSFLSVKGPQAVVKVNNEIGAIPAIRIGTRDVDNRVLGTRLTSVFKACLLARASISEGLSNVT